MPFFVHFLSRERKRNQKKTPVRRLTLRVGDRFGACRNSLALKQADTLSPPLPPMLGAAQREDREIRILSILKANIRLRRIGTFGKSASQRFHEKGFLRALCVSSAAGWLIRF
jgi:hypothetical protein